MVAAALAASVAVPDGAKHVQRRRLLAKIDPAVTELYGHDSRTAVIIGVALAVQWAMYLLVVPTLTSWWSIFGLAYILGACIHHMCYVCMHEVVHDLAFPEVSEGERGGEEMASSGGRKMGRRWVGSGVGQPCRKPRKDRRNGMCFA